MTSPPRSSRRYKWIVASVSFLVAIALSEALLRVALFHTPVTLAAKDPQYYARTLDEYWIYHHLFASDRRWTVAAGGAVASGESPVEFYRKWPTSLAPDAEQGYARKPGVKTPCHETTNLATRGTRDYAMEGRRIVFLGDSFVESAACSNDTLTTKVEKLTGIDTLNYGVGGYGVDQVFLTFRRVLPGCDRKDCLFLIGLIRDDFDRLLLRVRTSPKPYFTISDDRLVLHTDHIHPDALNDFYRRPPERFYLYYFLRGRLGFPVYASMLTATRDERRNATLALSRLIFAEMAERMREGRFRLALVIFPTPWDPFDKELLALLRAQGIPVVDLQDCLGGKAGPELYAESHPTSLANSRLAECLVGDLASLGLLPR